MAWRGCRQNFKQNTAPFAVEAPGIGWPWTWSSSCRNRQDKAGCQLLPVQTTFQPFLHASLTGAYFEANPAPPHRQIPGLP